MRFYTCDEVREVESARSAFQCKITDAKYDKINRIGGLVVRFSREDRSDRGYALVGQQLARAFLADLGAKTPEDLVGKTAMTREPMGRAPLNPIEGIYVK